MPPCSHDARGVAARAGREPQVGVPVLQARDTAPPRWQRRIGDQHRIVRGRHGRGDVAGLLHRLQGRCAVALAGASVQFARRGIRVNALCPGPVDTPLLRELFAKDPEKAARRLVHLPIGRFAHPREIAQAALFLASDESSYVNASTFVVDGGLSGAYVTPLDE